MRLGAEASSSDVSAQKYKAPLAPSTGTQKWERKKLADSPWYSWVGLMA